MKSGEWPLLLIRYQILIPPLTLQPLCPKLRLSRFMREKRANTRIFALLLAVLFLGAQLHFCADFTPAPSGTHLCPVCSAAISAAVSSSPAIALVPLVNRLETVAAMEFLPMGFRQAVSSRAPPAF